MFCNPKSNQIQNYFITTFIWNQAQGSNGNTWRLDWCRGGVKTGVVDNTYYGSRRDGAGLMLVFCKKLMKWTQYECQELHLYLPC